MACGRPGLDLSVDSIPRQRRGRSRRGATTCLPHLPPVCCHVPVVGHLLFEPRHVTLGLLVLEVTPLLVEPPPVNICLLSSHGKFLLNCQPQTNQLKSLNAGNNINNTIIIEHRVYYKLVSSGLPGVGGGVIHENIFS